MKSRKRSLRTRLLLWLIVPMTVFGLIAAWITHANARRTADLLQDAALLAAARVMAADVHWNGNDLVASISPGTIQIVGAAEGDQVFYRVERADGANGASSAVIAGTSDFPGTRLTASPQWYDAKVGALPIRAVSLERPMYDDGRVVRLIVSVGRTLTARDALIASLWRPQLAYILGSIAVAILLICAGLALELRPLDKLAGGLAALVASRRDIELAVSFDGALIVSGSEPLLAAVVSNLVDNAIRYSPKGTRATVEGKRADATVLVDVIDEGPGIPAALRERVFEEFSAHRGKKAAG